MSNIGAKLKTLAVVVAVISGAGSFLLLIAALSQKNDLVLYGIVLAVAGLLGAVIMLFVLYGFGQLIENSDIIAGAVKNGAMKVTQQPIPSPVVHTAASVTAYKKPDNAKNPTEHGAKPQRSGKAIRIDEENEQCSFCGTVQKAGRSVCWNCGLRFEREE